LLLKLFLKCSKVDFSYFKFLEFAVELGAHHTLVPKQAELWVMRAVASTVSTAATKPAAAVQPDMEQSTCTSELKLVVNEVLFFVHNKSDCMPKADIRSTIADFFREDEILSAKQPLCQHMDSSLCQTETIQPLLKKRIGENKVVRTIDDIMNIFDAVDVSGARGLLPVFCAASLSRIPTILDD